MCGIVGYIGDSDVTPILVKGLKKLEYRGYDSAGIAVIKNGVVQVSKAKGRLSILEDRLTAFPLKGTLGIGHTRWATHGEPSDVNSHPHTNMSGAIAVVHNGIIENYISLKEWLIEAGYAFVSDTDTEVVAHLINHFYVGDVFEAVKESLYKIEGSYALAVICADNPDEIIAVRKDSPLVIGLGSSENYIASDITALLEYTRDCLLLDDKEIAVVKKNEVTVYNLDGKKVNKETLRVNWDVASAEKGGYKHFMLKEIYEQPEGLKATISPRIEKQSGRITLNNPLPDPEKIFVVACGTAYHAGYAGKLLIESLAKIPVEVDIASEFRYRNPIIKENDLVIVISQSGETADTIAAMREAKRNKAYVLAVTNVVGSTVSREADSVFYTWAGPEIAVASTKAYTTQLLAMTIIALELALKKGQISDERYAQLLTAIENIPIKVKTILNDVTAIQRFANQHFNAKHIFFMGRGLDHAIAMEGSLKLKEISYIHSEAYAAGELKHGTIALIENGTLVIALDTQQHLHEKMISNIKEVKARGAVVIAIALEGNSDIAKVADHCIYLPFSESFLTPIPSVVPLQLFAYYVAVEKGCDVDKPRNLAKSVTVE